MLLPLPLPSSQGDLGGEADHRMRHKPGGLRKNVELVTEK